MFSYEGMRTAWIHLGQYVFLLGLATGVSTFNLATTLDVGTRTASLSIHLMRHPNSLAVVESTPSAKWSRRNMMLPEWHMDMARARLAQARWASAEFSHQGDQSKRSLL